METLNWAVAIGLTWVLFMGTNIFLLRYYHQYYLLPLLELMAHQKRITELPEPDGLRVGKLSPDIRIELTDKNTKRVPRKALEGSALDAIYTKLMGEF